MIRSQRLRQLVVGLALVLASVVPGREVSAATEARSFTRVLLPVYIDPDRPVEGAFGSRWVVDLVIFNHGDRTVEVDLDTGCRFTGCPAAKLEPGRTVIATNLLLPPGKGDPPTVTMGVEEAGLQNLDFELRVRDLSRQALGWGSELPVIPEANARTEAIQLLDVVVRDTSRTMLRVYDFDPGGRNRVAREVIVRFFGIHTSFRFVHEYPPDELLAEKRMTFQVSPSSGTPGLIQLPLDPIEELQGWERLRIEIEPVTPDLRFWAMASVTNNQTQHVTIISPDQP